MKKVDELDGDIDNKYTLPSHLAAFILSKSKRIMDKFARQINGFYNKSINYGDTDSLYVGKKMGCVRKSWFSWIRSMSRQKRV